MTYVKYAWVGNRIDSKDMAKMYVRLGIISQEGELQEATEEESKRIEEWRKKFVEGQI